MAEPVELVYEGAQRVYRCRHPAPSGLVVTAFGHTIDDTLQAWSRQAFIVSRPGVTEAIEKLGEAAREATDG